MSEIEKPVPLESQPVERYRLKIIDGERIRRVSARAIIGANGQDPAISLGKNIEVGFISGGEAVNRLDKSIVKVDPPNIAIMPSEDGGKLRVYILPE